MIINHNLREADGVTPLCMFTVTTVTITIKAASSDDRALAVHARRGMLLSGCAAYSVS